MIILSLFILNNINKPNEEENNNDFSYDFTEFFEILTSLCTSNVCNIRGFAQFFINKFNEIFKENKEKNLKNKIFKENNNKDNLNNELNLNISEIFMNYLSKNTNIQKFFRKFDETFIKFLEIYQDFSYANLFQKNFDDLNCEIIPVDITNEFKELGMKMMKLQNEDLTKPNISWRWGLCPDLMECVLKSEKLGNKKSKFLELDCQKEINNIIKSENNNFNSNMKIGNFNENENNESIALDFQKKYRPEDFINNNNKHNKNNEENSLNLNKNENENKLNDSIKNKNNDANFNINFSNENEDTEDYEELKDLEKVNKKRKRLDIVIMASLIDKAPNLGGLARTCEVFNMGCMTICSEAYLNDIAFLTAASSAEKWLPLVNLPVNDIEIFLISYKKLGYKIIGLEQTSNSITLKDFKFEEKIVVVLGNEKEGIPQNIINLIDYCVIIPQYGEIRSLNVHVSAALMLWEISNAVNK